MEADRFSQLLADHHSLQQLAYQDLERVVMEHPYCQTMRFLLLKKVQMDDHPASQRHLELAATYAPDRAHLYAFLNGLIHIEDDQSGFLEEVDTESTIPTSNLPEAIAPTPPVEATDECPIPEEKDQQEKEQVLDPTEQEPPTNIHQPVEPSPGRKKELESFAKEEMEVLDHQELHKPDENLEPVEPSPDLSPKEGEKEKTEPPQEAVTEDSLESIDEESEGEFPEHHETEEQLLELLSAVENSGLETAEELVAKEETFSESPSEPDSQEHPPVELEEAIPPDGTPESANTETSYSTSKFVQWLKQKDTTIRPEEPKDDPKLKEAANLAAQSVEADVAPLTETLAKILVAQGNKTQAIEVYQKLSLKFPEKSSYFAALIKDLEK